MNEQIKPKIIGNVYKAEWVKGTFGGTVYDAEQIAPTLLNMSAGGGRVPIIYDRTDNNNSSGDATERN